MKNTVSISSDSWSNFWANAVLQIGHPYRSDLITKKLNDDYSIVKWYVETDKNKANITYTDEKLITWFLLRWA